MKWRFPEDTPRPGKRLFYDRRKPQISAMWNRRKLPIDAYKDFYVFYEKVVGHGKPSQFGSTGH